MNSEQGKALKEIFRRNFVALAEVAANFADEVLTVLSETQVTDRPDNVEQPKKNKDSLLKKKEVAELLQISPRSINDRMNEGMPSIGVGRNVRFDREDVLEWAKNQNIKGRRKNLLRVVK